MRQLLIVGLMMSASAANATSPQDRRHDELGARHGALTLPCTFNIPSGRGPFAAAWMRFVIGFDPSSVALRVACPVVAVFGGRDLQVPAAVHRAKLEAVPVVGRNYLFLQAVTGRLAEYATLPRVFVASLVEDIAGWIEKRSETLRRIALFVAFALNSRERVLRGLRG